MYQRICEYRYIFIFTNLQYYEILYANYVLKTSLENTANFNGIQYKDFFPSDHLLGVGVYDSSIVNMGLSLVDNRTDASVKFNIYNRYGYVFNNFDIVSHTYF